MVECQGCHSEVDSSYVLVTLTNSAKIRWLCYDCIRNIVNDWYMLMEDDGDEYLQDV